jgi:hypothetical protein
MVGIDSIDPEHDEGAQHCQCENRAAYLEDNSATRQSSLWRD